MCRVVVGIVQYASCVLICCASTSCWVCPEGLNGGELGEFARHHFIHSGQHKPMARQHLPESGAQGMKDRDGARGAVHEPRPIVREQSCPQHEGHRGLLCRRLAGQLQPLMGGRLLVKDLQSRTNGKQSNKHIRSHSQAHTRAHNQTHTPAHIHIPTYDRTHTTTQHSCPTSDYTTRPQHTMFGRTVVWSYVCSRVCVCVWVRSYMFGCMVVCVGLWGLGRWLFVCG
jgi:hypothetical protein